jgi:MYXO-CTERM domain-containing protein
VDGVCCENACSDTCVSCNQAGRQGKCTAYASGSDPESECGSGSDPCRHTCNGAGTCDAPKSGTFCGICASCDGAGTCTRFDPALCGVEGADGGADAGAGATGGNGGATGTGGQGGTGGSTGLGGNRGGTGGNSGAGGNAGESGSSLGGSSGRTDGGSVGAGGSSRADAGGTNDSSDAGRSFPSVDADQPDATRSMATDTIGPDGSGSLQTDAGFATKLHRSGCNCDFGRTGPDWPALPLLLLGGVLLWRRLRRREVQGIAALVLLLFATCTAPDPTGGHRLKPNRFAMGSVPATESAAWTHMALAIPPVPSPRYLLAAAFDDTREKLVTFGGLAGDVTIGAAVKASQEIWEWDPVTSAWTNRTPAGVKPGARGGAGMVYDSTRRVFVIFGGRSMTGLWMGDPWQRSGWQLHSRTGLRSRRRLQRQELHYLFQHGGLRLRVLRGRGVLRECLRRRLQVLQPGRAPRPVFSLCRRQRSTRRMRPGRWRLPLDLQRRGCLRLSTTRNTLRDLSGLRWQRGVPGFIQLDS